MSAELLYRWWSLQSESYARLCAWAVERGLTSTAESWAEDWARADWSRRAALDAWTREAPHVEAQS